MNRIATQIVITACAWTFGCLTAFAQAGPELDLRTIVGVDAVPAGGEARGALIVTLPEGWHANANKPLEDFLIPTVLKFDDHPAIDVTEVVYAEPEIMKFGFSDEPMAVYEGEFLIGFAFEVADTATAGDHELTGTLRYQACDDTSCYAPKNVSITVPIKVADASYVSVAQEALQLESLSFGMAKPAVEAAAIEFGAHDVKKHVTGGVIAEFDSVKPGESLRLVTELTVEDGWHINSHKPLETNLIGTNLTVDVPEGFTVAEIAYPEHEVKTFSFSPDPVAVYEANVPIGFRIEVAEDIEAGEYPLDASLLYQACNDTQCQAPITETFTIPVKVAAGEAPIRLASADIFDAIDWTSGGQVAQPTEQPGDIEVADAGDWETLLPQFTIAAEASGFMKPEEFIAFIDGAESGEGFSQGGFLVGRGILFILGVTLFGGLLLNLTPCVLPVIPINLAIIGAGVYGLKKGATRTRGFLLGATYGLGIALVFGGLGLIVVFGLGSFGAINANWWFSFGIAALFIVLALAMFNVIVIDFTKYQKYLGAGQAKGTYFSAFVMGAISALLAGACVAPVLIAVLLYSQDAYAKGQVIGLILPFVLGLGMALPWPFAGAGMAFLPKPGLWMERVKQAMGVFILGFALYYAWMGWGQFSNQFLVDEEAVQASVEQLDEEGWIASLGDGLAMAKAENKPVLIDFWATWCKNCLTMNKTTLVDEQVTARLENYVKIKYQAELPDESPHKEVLDHFEKYVGLPHYAILTP